jgi:putative oxidoreductase
MRRLFETNAGWAGLILRLGLGIVMLPHGLQKLVGWFGGYGFSGTLSFFTDKQHIPAVLAVLVIIAESFGSIGLIVGLLTRITAFGIVCDMIGALVLVHYRNGFFMNWAGQKGGEGFEFHILVISIGIALILSGAGKASIDRAIAAIWRKQK